ncbi:MAG: hypothetical protein IKT40_06245 [Bacilli bacterium]|nr:hypothetical protein [Bacilli bacterium]
MNRKPELKEQAKKFIKDYDYFKENKEKLNDFEFELVDYAQYLNEYNIILEKQHCQVYSEKHQLLQKIDYLEKRIEEQHDTIKKLNKNQIDNQLTFAMFKQKFDKTKLNNEHDVMKKLNDLLTENKQLKDKIRIIQRDNNEIKYYKDNYIRICHEKMALLGLIDALNKELIKLKKENKQ